MYHYNFELNPFPWSACLDLRSAGPTFDYDIPGNFPTVELHGTSFSQSREVSRVASCNYCYGVLILSNVEYMIHYMATIVEVGLGHGCANHDTKGKRFKFSHPLL